MSHWGFFQGKWRATTHDVRVSRLHGKVGVANHLLKLTDFWLQSRLCFQCCITFSAFPFILTGSSAIKIGFCLLLICIDQDFKTLNKTERVLDRKNNNFIRLNCFSGAAVQATGYGFMCVVFFLARVRRNHQSVGSTSSTHLSQPPPSRLHPVSLKNCTTGIQWHDVESFSIAAVSSHTRYPRYSLYSQHECITGISYCVFWGRFSVLWVWISLSHLKIYQNFPIIKNGTKSHILTTPKET